MTKPRSKRAIDSRPRVRHSKSRRSKNMTDFPHRDPMQEFADRILAELEKGVKPWVRPWDSDQSHNGRALSRHQRPHSRYASRFIYDRRSTLLHVPAGGREGLAGKEGREVHHHLFYEAVPN